MTNTNHSQAALSAIIELSEQVVKACVSDRRVDSLAAFGDLDAQQQIELAQDAWSVGLHALLNAHSQARESRLQDVGQTLLNDFENQLRRFVESQQQTMLDVLGRYFDPNDGAVVSRLQEFTKDEGALARLLQKYLSPQNSVLAQTLSQQVGQQSELFKKLSPTESDGLVQVLETRLKNVIGSGHSDLVRAMDPLVPDGPVARFLHALREELQTADEDRDKQLATAIAALDANDETSLVSRLMRETHEARRSLLEAVNPDAPGSPMATIKSTLTTMLSEHIKSQRDATELQKVRQDKLEIEIRESLARLEAKRQSDQGSPRGGLDFESAVTAFVKHVVAGGPYVAEPTGNSVGVLPRRKIGDLVVKFTQESAYEGAALVVESKRDASYTIAKSLDELDLARKNREAGAGVFVMARTHAGPDFPIFARSGHNVSVIWDPEDSSTDPYLHAAVLLGIALATRKRHLGDTGDLQALTDVEQRIATEIERLAKIAKANESIRRQSETISDEVRKGREKLDILVCKAKETLKALNVEIQDEGVERQTPISFESDSLDGLGEALKKASGE